MSNIQGPRPAPVTVTIVDPKLVDEMKRVKADTEAILEKLDARQEPDRPRYFPKGYFP